MTAIKLCSYKEQNANTLAGVQVTSATYAGTNITTDLAVKIGVQAPVIQIVGTQTASTVYIGLDTANATHGAQVVIKRIMATPGTSVLNVYSGLAGTGFGAVAPIATGTGNVTIVAAFDGQAGAWR
jgi:hypothetical protein